MLTYTLYSEAGGVGKSTLAGNLAVAHRRHGLDVLLIDLDPQDASVSALFGVDDQRGEDIDSLAKHMVSENYADGPVRELIRTAEGVDIIPSHNSLEQLPEWLIRAKIRDGEFEPAEQLRDVLGRNDVHQDYDVILIDPPATSGQHVYNAVFATRRLVVPLELSGKGDRSIEGLDDIVAGLEDQLDINVGAEAVVPIGLSNLSAHRRYLDEIQASTYDVPVVIRDRESLFGGCWDQQCSAFEFVENHRSPQRDHEMVTVEKLDDLAARLEAVA